VKNVQKVGLYAWGGPATIRLIETKYHSPQIDTHSFLGLYDLDSLQRIRDTLNVTDMWVTYSWGFNDHREQEDYDFIASRLPNFAKVGIQAHAYIQGLNVVTADFPNADFFAVDGAGQPLSYSKGRRFICPNHPAARQLILDRVESACQLDFAGIYVDNILFGLPPVYVREGYASSFGCACSFCQERFLQLYGYNFVPYEKEGKQLQDYLEFRCNSVFTLLKSAQEITHTYHKELGINLYDPVLLDPRLYYGYDLEHITPLLDYFMVENHQHPLSSEVGNQHLRSFIRQAKKPVFVVSYKQGIGREPSFTQQDFDTIATEANQLGYAPCYKGTEFTTHGEWHAVRLEGIQPPSLSSLSEQQERAIQVRIPKAASRLGKWVSQKFDRHYASLVRAHYETPWLHTVIHKWGIFTLLMKQNRLKFSEKA